MSVCMLYVGIYRCTATQYRVHAYILYIYSMSITLSMSVTYMTSLSWLNITLTAGVSNAFRFVTKYIQGATQEMSQHVRPIP